MEKTYIDCPHCGSVMRVRNDLLGEEKRCPACQQTMTLKVKPKEQTTLPPELLGNKSDDHDSDSPYATLNVAISLLSLVSFIVTLGGLAGAGLYFMNSAESMVVKVGVSIAIAIGSLIAGYLLRASAVAVKLLLDLEARTRNGA